MDEELNQQRGACSVSLNSAREEIDALKAHQAKQRECLLTLERQKNEHSNAMKNMQQGYEAEIETLLEELGKGKQHEDELNARIIQMDQEKHESAARELGSQEKLGAITRANAEALYQTRQRCEQELEAMKRHYEQKIAALSAQLCDLQKEEIEPYLQPRPLILSA